MKSEQDVGHGLKITAVLVLPYEDGWTVGYGNGYYAIPVTKEEAIIRASAQAKSLGISVEIIERGETVK